MSDAPQQPSDSEEPWASPSPPPPPPTGGYVPPPYQPPPYPQPGYQPPPAGYQPYQQHPAPYGYPYQPYPVAKTEGTAIAALICAIGSFIVCIPILAIVALPLASSAKKKIVASNGQLTGLGLITASRWVAIINLVVWAGIVGLMVMGLAIDMNSRPASDFDNFQRLVVP